MDELKRGAELITEALRTLKKIPGFYHFIANDMFGAEIMVSEELFRSLFTEWETAEDYYDDGEGRLFTRIGDVAVFCKAVTNE